MAPISPRPRRFRLLAAALAVGVLSLAIGLALRHFSPHPGMQVEAKPPSTQPSAVTNTATVPPLPGTVVSPEEVLGKMDRWNAAHPNCHSVYTTTFPNGAVISRTEIFAFTNQVAGGTVKVKTQMFNPDVEFLGDKEDGKVRIYFPRSQQLLEPDMAREMFYMPTMPGAVNQAKDILKVARSSFAEASEDLEVVTLVIGGEAVNLTNDVMYLSFRINSDGKLLGFEAQGKNQRAVSTVNYLSFDREIVMHDAPVMPTGFKVITNKTLIETMQDEVKATMPKPLRPKNI